MDAPEVGLRFYFNLYNLQIKALCTIIIIMMVQRALLESCVKTDTGQKRSQKQEENGDEEATRLWKSSVMTHDMNSTEETLQRFKESRTTQPYGLYGLTER